MPRVFFFCFFCCLVWGEVEAFEFYPGCEVCPTAASCLPACFRPPPQENISS